MLPRIPNGEQQAEAGAECGSDADAECHIPPQETQDETNPCAERDKNHRVTPSGIDQSTHRRPRGALS